MGLFDRFRKKQDQQRLTQLQTKSASESSMTPQKGKSAETKMTSKKTAEEKTITSQKNFSSSHVLIAPLISEKSSAISQQHQAVFHVQMTATKNEVAKAVREGYGVKPLSVRMVIQHAKAKNFGRRSGFRSAQKKAYVTFPKNSNIDVFHHA